jgi:hypothetical protein
VRSVVVSDTYRSHYPYACVCSLAFLHLLPLAVIITSPVVVASISVVDDVHTSPVQIGCRLKIAKIDRKLIPAQNRLLLPNQ